MSEDRTAPMQQPKWDRRQDEADDQETIMAGQDSPTPPTMPAGAPEGGKWQQPPGPGFVRKPTPGVAAPEPTTPQRYQPPMAPPPPPRYPQPEAPADQTMLIRQQQTAPAFAWLVVVEGPQPKAIGQVHTLHPDTSSIGRVQGNHIVLSDETCSAQHARIRVEVQKDETGQPSAPAFMLYDMGSRNGTYVGDRETYRNEENRKYRYELQDGDFILIGETTLAFKKL